MFLLCLFFSLFEWNWLLILLYCACAGILLGQHVVSANTDALKLAAIIVTNTVYEAFLMFLLGYSLYEFPRTIWAQSNLEGYLLQTQMKAASQFKDISEAQLSVSLAVSDVLKTKGQVRQLFCLCVALYA